MRPVLAVLVLTLLLAPAAHADPIAGAVQTAETFWHDRGVQPCPDPTVIVGPLASASWDAAAQGCQITISSRLTTIRGGLWWRRMQLQSLCRTIVHEVGHTAGLGHTKEGIMAAWVEQQPVPWACVQWSHREARSPRSRR
jgi:hypothetical protein